MQLAKLSRERAVDAAYRALRQAIVGGHLKPGARLNVEELAGQLGVSLTPVRGAIQRLGTEGLVDIQPRSGTFVANLSLQDVEETFQIRAALECLAAELAAGRQENGARRRMTKLLKRMRKPLRGRAAREAHELDNSEFHFAIVEAAGNQRLIEMYAALNAHIKIARIHATESGWSARQRAESEEHEAIYEALTAGNAQEASAVLRRHIGRAREALLAALRKSASGAARSAP
jgi:DNA-binding GntR family transcriptional regulator